MTEAITVGRNLSGGNRRVKVLLGVALALLAAKLLLPMLLAGDDPAAATDLSFVPTTTPTTQPLEVAPDVAPPLREKNPFTPLMATAVKAASGGTVVVTGTAPAVQANSVAAAPAADLSVTSLTSEPSAQVPMINRVSLLEVYRDANGQLVASVRINDTTYQTAPNQNFAGVYSVVSLDETARCAALLAGQAPFALCEGDELLM